MFKEIENLFYKIQDKNLDGMEELEKDEVINARIEKIIHILIKK